MDSSTQMHVKSDVTTGAIRPIRRTRKILFICVIGCFFLVFQEACFRFVFPLPDVPSFNRINYTPLDLFDSTFRDAQNRGLSNVVVRWESEPDGFSFDHSLNLNGFRCADFQSEPPTDRQRIIFIGDSFVEGFGANDRETISEQFKNLVGGDHPVEAINLGVAGTGFLEYLRLARDGLYVLKGTHTVFLVLFCNDLQPPPFVEETDTARSLDFPRRNPWVPRAKEVASRLSDNLGVPRFFYSGPYTFLSPVPAKNNPLSSTDPPENIDPLILDAMTRGKFNSWLAGTPYGFLQMSTVDYSRDHEVAKYLRQINALCLESGAQLIIAYVPFHGTTNPAYFAEQSKLGGPSIEKFKTLANSEFRGQQAHLRRITQELNLQFLDLTDTFVEAEKHKGRMFWPLDGHCNGNGYRLIAENLKQFWNQTKDRNVQQ